MPVVKTPSGSKFLLPCGCSLEVDQLEHMSFMNVVCDWHAEREPRLDLFSQEREINDDFIRFWVMREEG